MSRADKARFDLEATERDRLAHERPNVPPEPFATDLEAWESRCNGNREQRHLAPSAKLAGLWRCGSCGRWLKTPKGRT